MLEALTGLTEIFLYYSLAKAQRREPLTMEQEPDERPDEAPVRPGPVPRAMTPEPKKNRNVW